MDKPTTFRDTGCLKKNRTLDFCYKNYISHPIKLQFTDIHIQSMHEVSCKSEKDILSNKNEGHVLKKCQFYQKYTKSAFVLSQFSFRID